MEGYFVEILLFYLWGEHCDWEKCLIARGVLLANYLKKSFDEIKIDVSISDDYPFVNAVVIVSE